MKSVYVSILFSMFLLPFGCSDTEFGSGENGSSSSGSKSDSIDEIPTNPDDPIPDQTGPCVKNGVVQLKYPALIKSCIEEGKIYNFDTEQCSPMTKATFACDFPNLIQEIETLGLNPAGMEKGQTEDGLLVGCGQSSDGKTIVGQWWADPTEDNNCEFIPGQTSITTGCYQIVSGDAGPQPVTQEEIAAKVLKCINSN
jgi:hypothetical protein